MVTHQYTTHHHAMYQQGQGESSEGHSIPKPWNWKEKHGFFTFRLVSVAIWTAKPRPVGHRPPPRSFLALTRPRDATDACPPRTSGNWKWYSTYTPRVAFLFRFSIYPSAFHPLTNSFLSTPNKLIKIISRQNRPRRRAGLASFSSASLPCRVSRLLALRRPVRAAKPELNLTCLTPIIHFRSIPLLKGA